MPRFLRPFIAVLLICPAVSLADAQNNPQQPAEQPAEKTAEQPPDAAGDTEAAEPTAEEAQEQAPPPPPGSAKTVAVVHDQSGYKLQVNGRDFIVKGMNWGYVPIGENYRYDLWSKPDAFIAEVLGRDMTMLKEMGVNAIRVEVGIPAKWITFIYQNWGIFTSVNHLAGRYGFLVNGSTRFQVDYSDPATREAIKADVIAMVEKYKNTPGLLFWLLGNENNYHLLPPNVSKGPQDEATRAAAVHLYTMYNEIIGEIKKRDTNHPAVIANGDLLYIDLIKKHCPNLEILGTNTYRGVSFGDLWLRAQKKLGLPVLLTEFGADAFHAQDKKEDHLSQANYLRWQWADVLEQTHGKGNHGIALGGFVFEWSDGWWKYRQILNLDKHDPAASWAAAGYQFDWKDGTNNMNEEWMGICAKGPSDEQGKYELYPRTAYYVLQEAFALDPYAEGVDVTAIRQHFAKLDPKEKGIKYEAAMANVGVNRLSQMFGVGAQMKFEMIYADGDRSMGEDTPEPPKFDHMESFFLDFEVNPSPQLEGRVSLNVLGNVPTNKIDKLFYESRGTPIEIEDADGNPVMLTDNERIKVYQSELSWDNDYFKLDGYYRTGHYHWGAEGDFFGLYREAFYGENIDIYNASAPFGMVLDAKKALKGLKVAFGPQLYWSANPMVLAKYHRQFGPFSFALMHQEDLTKQEASATARIIPEPKTRKTTLFLGYRKGALGLSLGGIFAGSDKLGEKFVAVRDAKGTGYMGTDYAFLTDEIYLLDTLGAKARLTLDVGPIHWYVQGAYQGLVADGGPDNAAAMVPWTLKADGRGNQFNALTGLRYQLNKFFIAPNVLFQRPLEGALPTDERLRGRLYNGVYYPGIKPRNILDDPFAVLGNRETYGFELVLMYDPTPKTWFWDWDNDEKEDAPFAAALDFVYKIQPTQRDATTAISAEYYIFAFDGAPPAKNEWDGRAKLFFNPAWNLHIVSDLYVGQIQGYRPESRLLTRYGAEARLMWDKLQLHAFVKFNDFGPYDYHRDFDLTFPMQVMGDLSYGMSLPKLFIPYTRLGARYQMRWLDQHSERYPHCIDTIPQCTVAQGEDRLGNEYEFVMYMNVSF